jgi:hypothetical protein
MDSSFYSLVVEHEQVLPPSCWVVSSKQTTLNV